ncbi:MAG: hypothetical protein U9N07_07540 [Euryarchaeota archaeon]|nr:hypothetical protein [Euryarchaeota archaeon]
MVASLFVIPASCEVIKPIIIEYAVNIGAVDITLRYNASVVNVTNVTGGDFDAIVTNLEHVHEGWVRIGAFQMDNPGLNGQISLASVTLDGDVDDLSSLSMAVNTLRDATPQCSPIDCTVEGFTITASSASPGSRHGGGGAGYMPEPTSTPAMSPSTSSVTGMPIERETPAKTTTPEHVTVFHTEPSSPPSPILSPIAGIVIVVIVVVFGIIRVISTTAQTRDETHAETVTPTEQTEQRKAIAAIIGIVVVAIVAIIGILLI